MTITLDYVLVLLHLLIVGKFCLNETLDFDVALETFVDLLGVDCTRTTYELRKCCSPHVKLSWMRNIYNDCCENQRYKYVVQVHLLHLVRCTIFVDKSVMYIHVSYLMLFRDIQLCNRYARGVATFESLYE